MNIIQELLKPEHPTDISQQTIFEYPFLFNIQPDGNTDISVVDIDSIHSNYVFESLVPLSCDVFKNAFRWKKTTDALWLERYSKEANCEPTMSAFPNRETIQLEFISRNIVEAPLNITQNDFNPSLETYEWVYDLSSIKQMSNEFKRVFEGNMVPVGRSFTEKPLYYGTLGNYFVQYLADGLFGHPNAVVCIQNQREITDAFKKLYIHILQQLSNVEEFNDFAQKLRMVFTEAEPERWDTKKQINDFPFRQGDILEFFVRIDGSIYFPNDSNNEIHIQQTWMNLINQSNICNHIGKLYNQIWKIRFILL
jgi:hypothetical protein